MPAFPYVQNKKLPSDLVGVDNGKLDPRSLASLSREAISTKIWEKDFTGYPGQYPIWTGHKLAIAAVELMIKAAAIDKIDIRVTGCYRSYGVQEQMFNQRYTSKRPNEKNWNKQAKAARKGFRKLDEMDKVWNGKRYWLANGGGDPSAVPGESNHGLGIAFDLEFGLNKSAEANKAIQWIRENGFAFGFYWDTGYTTDAGWEQWHLTYCFGDDYGCLPLVGGSGIIPAPPSNLKPIPPSKRVGNKMVQTMGRRTASGKLIDPVLLTNTWKWWIPQPIDWYDNNRANTLVPFNAFPINPPSAV
jgi:hypothetical protein